MEDGLKILKVEYLSNHLLNLSQILNLSLDDQTIMYNEDDLKWKISATAYRIIPKF